MRLFICNLPWEATVDDLKNWLVSVWGYDVTDVKIIMHAETGRSRGFGFVEFPNEVQGQAALLDLNSADFMGRPLKVNLATRKDTSHRQSKAGFTSGPPASRDQGGGAPNYRNDTGRSDRARRDEGPVERDSSRRRNRDDKWSW